LGNAYDRALADVDVLLLPTAPSLPHELSDDLAPAARLRRGWSVFANTSQFNMTGHPALTVPAAAIGGLPVGAMLVGRRSDDARLLAIARVYERELGWRP
ncbi:MAG: amidase family protein, partial [Actinomycetota bacterium]|nr:amidase family protein [Actinomycetota bacterium]